MRWSLLLASLLILVAVIHGQTEPEVVPEEKVGTFLFNEPENFLFCEGCIRLYSLLAFVKRLVLVKNL